MQTSELNVPDAGGIYAGDRPAAFPNIAFVGKMGAGKSTAASIAISQYKYNRISFAQKLKDIAVDLWGPDAATDREKLQALGVFVRELEPDTWASHAFRIIDNAGGEPWVVDDCRFPNEYYGLRGRGFVIVEVTCPEEQRVDRLMRIGKLDDLSQLEHESETALDDILNTPGGVSYSLSNEDERQFELDVCTIIERERK